jgi:hypothetical protein
MGFLESYKPLYKIYHSLKSQNLIVNKVKLLLKNLHEHTKKIVTKEEYYSSLEMEIYTKIIERYTIIQPIISKYSHIKKINGIEIIPFLHLVDLIKNEIYKIVARKNEYYFVPIHGDCQFNNVLFNVENEDIVFIDPRGYYGNNEIFGIEEYDFAKVDFALSGYDEFDNRHIDNLNITHDNIEIIVNSLDKNILQKKSLEVLLMLSIWLGNSHCFITNESKAVYSYFIAMYLGSLYFNLNIPVI